MVRKKSWKPSLSAETYNIKGWGSPYFSVTREGHVAVHPQGKLSKSISLKTLVDQIIERGISTPVLLRFNDILTHRMAEINNSFTTAIRTYGYTGKYHTIFPIKVNQQRHVVDRIVDFAMKKDFGLEAGSKPELLAVLALSKKNTTPIVCNGYKDREFFQIALMGRKIGKPVYPVIEKYSEFETMIEVAKELKVMPLCGVRVKLSASGSGKWQSSGGPRSKFGLTITELMRGIELLKEHEMLDGLNLLHFHLGSQITNISAVKKALKEAGRVYAEMIKLGVLLKILDVGGGLGVDYDGSRSSSDSSINYTLQQYANDVVFQIQEICDQAGVDHPDIFTECGRAVVAHHAVLVFNVLGISGFDRAKLPESIESKAPSPLRELFSIRQSLKRDNVIESYHDAVNTYQECLNLFNLGYLSISDRGLAEEFYFSTLKRCQDFLKDLKEVPEELENLEFMLSDTYFCNFSVFQSLPDHWAIDHQFPIMPIHRLDEEPKRLATIADITCDSDGKIESFIDTVSSKKVMPLHAHGGEKDYYLGAFLVGAYQETLGDLHNLFGDTNAVHVSIDRKGKPVLETVVKGDTVKEVLTYVQYDIPDLIENMHRQLERAVNDEHIDYRESGLFLKFFEDALEGYTYLEETESKEEY